MFDNFWTAWCAYLGLLIGGAIMGVWLQSKIDRLSLLKHGDYKPRQCDQRHNDLVPVVAKED